MSRPEVWLRGPLPGVPPLLQPVAHSLLQCREEIDAVLRHVSSEQLHARPGGAASIEYHAVHAAGSLDRLLTYARGESLSHGQLQALADESREHPQAESASVLTDNVLAAIDRAVAQVRETAAEVLLEPREVGRGRLPSTVLGLLFHAAEHTQRHVGQLVTTARILRGTLALFLALALAGCATTAIPLPAAPDPAPGGIQATSLLGAPLREFPLDSATRTRYERDLAAARRAYDEAPNDPEAIVWFGRRLAYLGYVREAIAVYSRGIDLHPVNPWLYRHRGHRYLTVRQFDDAVRDLAWAERLIARIPDQVEEDGQPNARNLPIGTLHSNIRYHLGLAHYLRGDFAAAVPVYEREMATAANDDRRVSTAHWLYMALRRLGREADAARVLDGIRPDMNVVENQAYHRLLLMYKGLLPVDSLLPGGPAGAMSVTDATTAYGIGNRHLYEGRAGAARAVFERIVAGGQWPAFGYIAAEAELARMGRAPARARADDRAHIEARGRTFSEAYMRGDVDAMVALYTDDAVIFPGNAEAIVGREAVRRYWALPPGQRITHHRAVPTEITIDGEHAYDHGVYEIAGERDGVAWGPTRGKYVIVWRREPDGWRMKLDMWNSRP